MSTSILESVESIKITTSAQKALQVLLLSKQDLEEVLFNFPTVHKISVSFSDHHQRFIARGQSDTGKKIGIVFYIHNKKIVPTYIYNL